MRKPNLAVLVGGLLIGVPLGLVFSLIFLGEANQQQLCGGGTSDVSAAGEPPLVQYYIGAANRYGMGQNGYAYLAAINDVETTFGTNLSTSTAGALGWMQFEPGTFVRYGVAVSQPGGTPDAYDPQDAIYSAANYLHASGAPGNWSQAIFAYNHSPAYVAQVEALAARYSGPNGLQDLRADITAAWGGRQPTGLPAPTTFVSYPGSQAAGGSCCPTGSGTPVSVSTTTTGAAGGGASAGGSGCGGLNIDVTPVPGPIAVILPNGLARPPAQAPANVQAMVAAGDRINSMDYQWGGGHANLALSDSQTHPQPQGGQGPGDNGTPGYDCSGSTGYVLVGGGFESYFGGPNGAIPSSGNFGAFGRPGRGRWVTWYFTAGHVFIYVAGIVFDTNHTPGARPPTNPPTGPRWTTGDDVAWEQSSSGPYTPQHPVGL